MPLQPHAEKELKVELAFYISLYKSAWQACREKYPDSSYAGSTEPPYEMFMDWLSRKFDEYHHIHALATREFYESA
jgi:hypothetical protein